MVEFSRCWLACPVIVGSCAACNISEVPLRVTLECFAQAPGGGEGLCICSENIDVCEHHLEEVARDNSLRRGDGRWRGHHSVDPSERRTGSTGPDRAKLEHAGVNFEHFGEEIRF